MQSTNALADSRLSLGLFPGEPTPRLYDRVPEVLGAWHHTRWREQAYFQWIQELPPGARYIKTTLACMHGLNCVQQGVNHPT